jgi:hypothetical protein
LATVTKVGTKIRVSEEERFRAQFYLLLSRLLGAAADHDLLNVIKGLEVDDTSIGQELTRLKTLAENTSVEAVSEEYNKLYWRNSR